jgi:hypothetical protein
VCATYCARLAATCANVTGYPHAIPGACEAACSESFPKAERAAELLQMLFPKGLQFLTLPMDAEWAVSEELLKRIKDDGLLADINVIAGPEFLAEVRDAHAVYGEVLGITKPKGSPADTSMAPLLEPLRRLADTISDYVFQVAASADRDEPETVHTARAALAPMDRFREATARRKALKGGEATPETTPETPVPEVPA